METSFSLCTDEEDQAVSARVSTFRVTLPSTHRVIPDRPWVHMMMRSTPLSFAKSMISRATCWPVFTIVETLSPFSFSSGGNFSQILLHRFLLFLIDDQGRHQLRGSINGHEGNDLKQNDLRSKDLASSSASTRALQGQFRTIQRNQNLLVHFLTSSERIPRLLKTLLSAAQVSGIQAFG